MFNITDFLQHTFHDGVITECRNECDNSILLGEFPEDEMERSGCKYFYFRFKSVEPKLPEMNDAGIISFEISQPDKEEKNYSVKICAEDNDFICAEFCCKDITFYRQKYKGMSYRNIYGTDEYNTFIESQKYVLDKEYFMEKEQFALPDNFSIEVETYGDVENMGNYFIKKAALQKCRLQKAGRVVYEYICTYHHAAYFLEFIHHSNGHRYYPFHISLYSVSYIDVDTGEVYNYIPEGYQHDCNILFGESFIITDIHYDPDSNLIAYGGCFWGGPSDVMVGDFSNPLHYKPQLVGMQSIVDSDYEKYDELDFDMWSREGLLLKANDESVLVDMNEIKRRLA